MVFALLISPEFEGIKTRAAFAHPFRVSLLISPEFEGIKTQPLPGLMWKQLRY